MKASLRASHPIVRAARHVDQLCLQSRRMRAITRMTTAAAGDFDGLLAALCIEAPALFAADATAIFLDEGDGRLEVRASIGLPPTYTRATVLAATELESLAAEHGDVLRLSSMTGRGHPMLLRDGLAVALAAIVRCRGEIAGLLLVAARATETVFTDDDVLYAEVLSVFLGARLAELELSRNVVRLQQALWEAARRAVGGDDAMQPQGDGEPKHEPA